MFKDDKVKAYILGVVSTFIVILAFIGVMSLVGGYRDKKLDDKIIYTDLYGTVKSYRDGYIIVEPIDEEIGEEIKIKSDKYYREGDFILINDDEITLIASSDSLAEVITTLTTTSRTTRKQSKTIPKTSTTTTSKKAVNTTTKNVTTTKKVTTTKIKDKADDVVIAYVEDANNYINNGNASDETFGDKAKRYFITVVDFIFYNGEIKGYKWNELTTSAKAKVVYYALKIDNKIDEKFPNYKENISNKYQDIKAKLVAKYLDITNTICSGNERNEYHCGIVKQDFELLKKSVGITWDIVVDAFKYAYNKTTDYLKTWYETFSGK